MPLLPTQIVILINFTWNLPYSAVSKIMIQLYYREREVIYVSVIQLILILVFDTFSFLNAAIISNLIIG